MSITPSRRNVSASFEELTASWEDETGPPVDRRRLVLVLVDRFDLRAMKALEYAWQIPAHERRALHVATDEAGVWELADAWMAHRPGAPLHMVERDGDVAATVRQVVEHELTAAYDEVVVLIGRVSIRGWWRRLLHDRSADEIARQLVAVPGAITAQMTIASI